jgi:hypothetical protein
VEFMVSDFSDAFHSMGVMEDERMHQIVAGMFGAFYIYESVVFGGGGSPLIWGRGAAFLGRSGQSLFRPCELCMELFVDDPLTAWAGTRAIRRRNMVVLLLWWVCVGLDIAWHKLEVGKYVKWIGTGIKVIDKTAVEVSIPKKYCEELQAQATELLKGKLVDAHELRRFAGRCSWAGGIVPCVASMLQPCWAALAEVDARRLGDQAQSSSTSASRSTTQHRRSVITPGGASVPTVRVAHALEWIREFARGQAGAISKVYSVAHRKRPVSVVITTDASPWGYGGFLMKDGVCLYY